MLGDVDGLAACGRDPGKQQLDGGSLERAGRRRDGQRRKAQDVLMGPAGHGRRGAQQAERRRVLDQVVDDLTQAVDRVDAVEDEQEVLPVQRPLEGLDRGVTGGHLGIQGVEARRDEGVRGRVRVSRDPGGPRRGRGHVSGDEGLPAAGSAGQGHPSVAPEEQPEAIDDFVAPHARCQHKLRLSRRSDQYQWFYRCSWARRTDILGLDTSRSCGRARRGGVSRGHGSLLVGSSTEAECRPGGTTPGLSRVPRTSAARREAPRPQPGCLAFVRMVWRPKVS